MPVIEKKGDEEETASVTCGLSGLTETLLLARHAKGECPSCGMQVRDASGGDWNVNWIPRSIPGKVLEGRCLLCDPIEEKVTKTIEEAAAAVPQDDESSNKDKAKNSSPAKKHSSKITVTTKTANDKAPAVVAAGNDREEEAAAPPEKQDESPRSVTFVQEAPAAVAATDIAPKQQEPRSLMKEAAVAAKQAAVVSKAAKYAPKKAQQQGQSPRHSVTLKDHRGREFVGAVLQGTPSKGRGIFSSVAASNNDNADHQNNNQVVGAHVYSGEFQDGHFHGRGSLLSACGTVYDGQFQQSQFHGRRKNVLVSMDGSRYEGQFKNNKCDGKGRFKSADGKRYEGDWKLGMRHGKGTFKWPNGAKYVGEWKAGMRHGHGKATYSNGNVYEGNFKDDMPDPKPQDDENYWYWAWKDLTKFLFKGGDVFKGDMFKGIPHCNMIASCQ